MYVPQPRSRCMASSEISANMPRSTPIETPPDMYFPLTPLGVSPNPSTPGSPNRTPLGAATYFPFRSAGLKPPAAERHRAWSNPPRHFSSPHRSWTRFRLTRVLHSRSVLLLALLATAFWCWSNGRRHDVEGFDVESSNMRNELVAPEVTKNLQFYPASNAKIHVGPD